MSTDRSVSTGPIRPREHNEPERTDRWETLDLLVVCHKYNTFVKDQTELLAAAFDSVTVLVRYNPIAEVSEFLPIQWLRPYRKAVRLDLTDVPANVTVEVTSLLYLPTDRGYEKLGAKHARAVGEQVERLGIDLDLIHAHFTWTAGYAATQLGDERDVPVILTVHANRDRFLDEFRSGIPGIYETWRSADTVIRVNERDVRLLERYNENVHAIPNGFSRKRYRLLDREEARSALEIDPDRALVFTLGELNSRKGTRYLIEAIPQVLAEHGDVLCVIGGQGTGIRELERRVRELGLEDHVEILGYVPEERVDLWMNACDVFTLASLAEGNPTVMFEALGCGKPYVGTNVGGVEEIITSEDYGLLCEPGDPDALAAILVEGLDREWDTERIAAYAEKFTWERITAEIESLYAEALDE
ncbi:glycosyltransferase family 4 protein [Halobacteriales archaeon QS_3_64_16]|nr:MAG: glycosyltransferase family 4 protein [Halobacteriales archaeon QS_3_64_16]